MARGCFVQLVLQHAALGRTHYSENDELDRDPLGDSVILTLSSRKLDLVDPLCELSRIMFSLTSETL